MNKLSYLCSLMFFCVFLGYSQSKEDIKIIKDLWNSNFYGNQKKIELKLIEKYPNNPVIKIYDIFKEEFDEGLNGPRYPIQSELLDKFKKEISFTDSIFIKIDNYLEFIITRNDKIKNLRDELLKRRDIKYVEEYEKHDFDQGLNNIYLDPIELNKLLQDLFNYTIKFPEEAYLVNVDSDFLDEIEKYYGKENFIFKTHFGKELFLYLLYKYYDTEIKNVFRDYGYNFSDHMDEFRIDLSVYINKSQDFINDRFSSSMRLKDDMVSSKRIDGETTIDISIEKLLNIFEIFPSGQQLLKQIETTESSEVVKILRKNGYQSAYIDLLDIRHKLFKVLFDTEIKDDIHWIFENVINFSHNYEWRKVEDNYWNFYKLEEIYTENDINTMKLIEDILKKEDENTDEYSKKLINHNLEIEKPTPKNCQSEVHKNTILKTQFYLSNGRKIYSVIYDFSLESSFDRESCTYIWKVIYTNLSGNVENVVFRSSSDFSQKNAQIKIEMFDWENQRYGPPVFVKPIN